MEVIREIAKVPTDMHDKPRIPVHILDCGEIADDKNDEDSVSESEQKVTKF